MAASNGNSSLGFWTNVEDGLGNGTLTVAVETETGQPVVLTIRDRESLETLAKVQIPDESSSPLGQALMLASTMKMDEQRQRLQGEGGL